MSRIYRMRNAVYCCAGGLLCLNLIPHTFPSIPIRSLSWVGNDPPPQLVDHVHKIAQVMGLPQTEKIHVFLAKGLTSVAFGSTWLPNGAAIGLPRTVLFQNQDDVRNSFLESAGAPIEWDSELGSNITSALIPSTQQINFVIAHEVAHLKTRDWMARVVLSPVALVSAYHVARALPLYVSPRHGLAGFVLVMAASLAVYLQLVASLSQRQEYRADKTAAQCSGSYAQGGLDHFAKRLKLDSALKSRKKASTFDRFKPSFSLHPPAQDRFDRLQTLIANSKNI